MAGIHQLPTVLSDQIAAGEVIERPASVVKELVENAIDAHSTKVDIEVEEAGLKSIKVVDDGMGIPNDKLALAFKRFATSKIANRRDLFAVKSLGFRGEALPSIAAIARVQMESATGIGEGRKIFISGGKLDHEEAAQARRGTSVLVSDLFYNTPERLKYLKAPSTELAKITDVVNRLALSHPEIAFSFSHNGRELLRTSGRRNLQQVIAALYGNQNLKKMVPVKAQDPDFQLDGYVSLPELTRASRKFLSVIVNGRYVRDFSLDHAIIDGYGSKLMVGRFPIVILNVKMDPSLVDVNVHPTKEEVRISKRKELGKLISNSIYQKLSEQNLIPDAKDNQTFKNGVNRHNNSEISFNLDSETSREPKVALSTPQQPKESGQSGVSVIEVDDKEELQSEQVQHFYEKYAKEDYPLPFGGKREAPNANHDFPRLHYVGQVHGTYLIAESENGMYVIDQHAAQERINYEYFRDQIGQVSDSEQKLLVPIVLDYPTSDAILLNKKLPLLQAVGLNLEPFGRNSFVIREHPNWFKEGQEKSTINEMIDWVLNDQQLSTKTFREKAAIMMSCKRAIKANHHLDEQQAKALLDNLHNCENPYNCPHGRPVLVHFSNTDLETMFKRIQDPHKTDNLDL